MSKGLFITGTGTDVGKTFVTALIIKKLREHALNAGYYKAALSGAVRKGDSLTPGDAEYICNISGIADDPCGLVSYMYETPVSPHLAARIEKKEIDMEIIVSDFLRITSLYDYVTVEGSGGIVCPLRRDGATIMLSDVIKNLGLNLLIVSPASLGSINSAVLTAEYIRTQGMTAKGFILNGYDSNSFLHRDNKKEIEALSGVPVVACVPNNASEITIALDFLLQCYKEV